MDCLARRRWSGSSTAPSQRSYAVAAVFWDDGVEIALFGGLAIERHPIEAYQSTDSPEPALHFVVQHLRLVMRGLPKRAAVSAVKLKPINGP